MFLVKKILKNISFLFLISFLFIEIDVRPLHASNGEIELFQVSQKAFEDGFYDVAMRYIHQLFEQYPRTDKHIEAHLLLGQCYFFKSQYLKAYDIFQKLLVYEKFKDATLFWLGETYLKGSDYHQAEKQYQELIKAYPNSIYTPQAYYSLGWVYFEQENFKQAKKIFLKLIKNHPIHQLTEDASFKLGEAEYNLQKFDNTIQYFKKYILTYPNSTRHAQSYFYIAESYYYLKDYLTSATYYAKAADIAYDHKLTLMSRVSLGWCYMKLEKYTLAQKNFDEAYQYSKEKGFFSDDVFLGQASLYAHIKEHEKALEAYTQLVEQFPNSKRILEATLGQANTYYLLKKYSQAIMAYQGVIDQSIDPQKDADILEKSYFGIAWSYLKAGNVDKAVQNFEAIKNKTKSKIVKISALTQIGDAYQDINQLEQAIGVYDRILEEYPDSPYIDYVQYRQGIALLKMEKIEAATLSFQSLQVNFPETKYLNDIKYYLAVAYFKKNNWSMAKKQIVGFIKDLPKNHEFMAEAQYIFALSLFNLEEYRPAIKVFQKIIKNYPTHTAMIKNSEISIAKCYYKLENFREGIKRFKILAIKYPKTDIAHESLIWLGDYYLGISKFDHAIAYYQQFVTQFPGSNQINLIWYELGQAYQVKEEYDHAINAFESISSKPDPQLYAKAKLAIANIFSEKFEESKAIEIYESIVKSSLEFRRKAYMKLAEIYKKSDNYTKIIDIYTQALTTDKGKSLVENDHLQFLIGDMYEFLNERQHAIESYFKIPYLYTENSSWTIKAYLRIARIFEDEENWNKAKTIYRKLIDLKTVESKFAQERMDWIQENIK